MNFRSFSSIALLLLLLANISHFPPAIFSSFIYYGVDGALSSLEDVVGLEEQYRVVGDTLFGLTTDVIDLSNSSSMINADHYQPSCVWMVIYYDSTCGHCRLVTPLIKVFAAWVGGVQNGVAFHLPEEKEKRIISGGAAPADTSTVLLASSKSLLVLKRIIVNHAYRRGWLVRMSQEQMSHDFFYCLLSPLIITAVNCAQFDGDCRSNAIQDVPTIKMKYKNKEGILVTEVLRNPEAEVMTGNNSANVDGAHHSIERVTELYSWVGPALDKLHMASGSHCSHTSSSNIDTLSHAMEDHQSQVGTKREYDHGRRHQCASIREYLISQKQSRIIYQRRHDSDKFKNISTSNPTNLTTNGIANKQSIMPKNKTSSMYKTLISDASRYHRQDVAGAFFYTLWYEVPMNGLMSSMPIDTFYSSSNPEVFPSQYTLSHKKEVLIEFLKVATDAIPWIQSSSLIGTAESGRIDSVKRWRQRLLAAHIPFRLVSWFDNSGNVSADSPIGASHIEWKSCRGSSSTYRGFTCGLWMLYHTMVTSSPDPDKALLAVKNYICAFFLCKECRQHFGNFTWTIPSDTKSNIATHPALQLWWAHNNVNKRLSTDTATNDPIIPKGIYPSKSQCPKCYNDMRQDSIVANDVNTSVEYEGKMNNHNIHHTPRESDVFPELHHFNLDEVLLYLQSVYVNMRDDDNYHTKDEAKWEVAALGSGLQAREDKILMGSYDKGTSWNKGSDRVSRREIYYDNVINPQVNHVEDEDAPQEDQNVIAHDSLSGGLRLSVLYVSFCVTVGIFGFGFFFGTRHSDGGRAHYRYTRKGTHI